MNLSIKNVPEALLKKLRARAEANHRSLQGELMNMLERELSGPKSSIMAFYQSGLAAGLRSPAESTLMIRESRDAGYERGRRR